MSKTVELLFDFVSPNAYLVWKPLRNILARHGARLEVTPVFLAGMHRLTGNAPPMIRDADVKGKSAYAMLEFNRFIAKHGLARFTMNPKFPFNSVMLQRMLIALEGDDRLDFIDALLPAIWEQQLDVTDLDAVAGAIAASGFDTQSLVAQAQDPAIKQALVDATDNAVERGAFGIPTMFVGDGEGAAEMFFGKERLAQIEELLAQSA